MEVGGSNNKMPTTAQKYDLAERLLEFSAVVIDVSEKLPDTRAGNHLAGQLLRSGTSPYGNHGEAQAPESAEDFILCEGEQLIRIFKSSVQTAERNRAANSRKPRPLIPPG